MVSHCGTLATTQRSFHPTIIHWTVPPPSVPSTLPQQKVSHKKNSISWLLFTSLTTWLQQFSCSCSFISECPLSHLFIYRQYSCSKKNNSYCNLHSGNTPQFLAVTNTEMMYWNEILMSILHVREWFMPRSISLDKCESRPVCYSKPTGSWDFLQLFSCLIHEEPFHLLKETKRYKSKHALLLRCSKTIWNKIEVDCFWKATSQCTDLNRSQCTFLTNPAQRGGASIISYYKRVHLDT